MRKKKILLCDYFENWIDLYKEGAVSDRTLDKYDLSLRHLQRIAPDITLQELDRAKYQAIINQYATDHERATTMDFHHQLRGAILDAYDDNLIPRDPTRKAVIKGRAPKEKKQKFLSEFELKLLLRHLKLGDELDTDWLILLVAKTGLRFAEVLGLTKDDFDFEAQEISVNKTWNYQMSRGGFKPTKNKSSVRKVQIDWKLSNQLRRLITDDLSSEKPVFVQKKRVFNSTINNHLKDYCEELNIPVISIHGLRHTHASMLLFAGVSVASVAKRLGHSDITTTQQTYIHIIQELENKDNTKILQHLASL